jgi:hypothetical protein
LEGYILLTLTVPPKLTDPLLIVTLLPPKLIIDCVALNLTWPIPVPLITLPLWTYKLNGWSDCVATIASPPIIILLIALAEIDESLLEIIELIDDPLDTVPLLNVSTFWPDNLNT